MKLRAVAWDIDGTLIDSEPLHHAALVSASFRFGTDLRDLTQERFLGVHMRDVWVALCDRLPSDLEESVWLGAIEDYYVANVDRLRPMDGAIETVRRLSDRGVPQACVSNSHRRIVDANLSALGILRHLQFSISFDDVELGKPHPEPYRKAIRQLDLHSQAILAVEDSGAGARSARSAGMRVAGYRVSGLFGAEVDWRIASLSEVFDIVDSGAAGPFCRGGVKARGQTIDVCPLDIADSRCDDLSDTGRASKP